MNQLQTEPMGLRTGVIDSLRLRQFCQLSPGKRFPPLPSHPPPARAGGGVGAVGLLEEDLCTGLVNVAGGKD